ncbi:phosphonate ABC transporter substrate-binding protein [Alsobacter soli]|uniref:Phosphonate ABC transporter substrate-binding protein n=1 Tax=Alsobacter soli TaxID=2109933 RepID=A0A2T1HW32_9HYPH|nr:phosphonate ABC transporter substrate-binding protein [Alsobacter soli]
MAWTAAAVLGGSSQARSASSELRFGLTPVFLTSDLELLARLKAYLEKSTGFPVRLITRRTYQEITALLLSGQIDAAWICGFPYVVYRPQLALVAVPVWQGKPLYRSYLITGRDRPANSIDDLRGDVHAFSDPDSNSGWLVTATALARRNQAPDTFFSQSIYTWGHRNVIRAVASGLAQSGSVDGYVYEVMRETDADLVGQTRVVARSDLLGFPPVACAASSAREPRTAALQSALVGMRDTDQGRAVLSMLRLDAFSIEPPSLFDGIAQEVAVVRGAAG